MKQAAAAFVRAQKAFGPALKSSNNPHFKSKYADLAACVEAVIDGLNDNGLGLIQRTSECESGVTVETILVHESGDVIECGKLHVPAAKQDPQGYGSALTYARRYSLMAACGIAPEDDDGNAASKPQQRRPSAKLPKPAEDMHAANMRDCTSIADLRDAAAAAIAACREAGDIEAEKRLGAIFQAERRRIQAAEAAMEQSQ